MKNQLMDKNKKKMFENLKNKTKKIVIIVEIVNKMEVIIFILRWKKTKK